jgi:Uma2 family endonuclease
MNPESSGDPQTPQEETRLAAQAPDTGGSQRRKATYADLEAVPPHLVAELVDGELYVTRPLASLQALALSVLLGELYSPFKHGRDGPGGWVLLLKPELHLGEDVLVPDLAGWRRERMPQMPKVVGVTLAPDWVCEVLSPSTASLDRDKKMKVYAREGVHHLWLVDPLKQTLEVYGLDGGRWTPLATHTGQALVHAEPFTPLLLELGVLWEG